MKRLIATLMSAEPSSQGSMGRSKCVNKDDEEEEKRQAELRRARDRLKKCVEDEDYTGASAAKEHISALMGAEPKLVEEEEEKRQTELHRARDQLQKRLEAEDYTGAADEQEKIATLMSADLCSQGNHGRSTADSPAATPTAQGSQRATGPSGTSIPLDRGAVAKCVAKDHEEEEKRQAELRLAQDRLQKCVEEEDYTGAAAVKESIAALMSAEPCSQRNPGRSTADWSAVSAAGHGSQSATGPIVSSATSTRHADAKRVGGEKEEKRQAELLRAQEQLKKCCEEEDYRGAAAAKEHISTLMGAEPCSHRAATSGATVAGQRLSSIETSKGQLSSIEHLVGHLPQSCLPVRLEGVTLLSIGKVSDGPNNGKGKGQGKGQSEKGKRGKKGKKGKGMIEAGNQKIQPVYFGDDMGNVICTLATGDDVNRIPATVSQNAYVDISSLKPQAGELGVLYWTESTQMSLRMRPSDSGCDYIFPYDVTSDYSKDFADMAFVRKCAVGTYVAIAMRINDVQAKWSAINEPYLQLMGVDTEGGVVGPLRLWQREEGDIKIGGAYVVRGLKVVNDRAWDSTRGMWIRSADAPKIIECSVRTACEDVEGVESITQYF